MQIHQFVMAYQAEQDRLRALLPDGFTSLRPVLRINAELRIGEAETAYLEFNTPVEAGGKRGWLNLGHWDSEYDELTCEKNGSSFTFTAPFLTITYTGVGIEGGCPAEQDNDGCFFPGSSPGFRPAEQITSNKEFCDCQFAWRFSGHDAHGISTGKTLPAYPTPPQREYKKQACTARNAAAIPCEQVLGSYTVQFER